MTREDQHQDDSKHASVDDDESLQEDLEAEAELPITLDRYLSRRRPEPRPMWAQMISLIAMLAALVMLMVYKDRCAGAVSGLMGNVAPEQTTHQKTSP